MGPDRDRCWFCYQDEDLVGLAACLSIPTRTSRPSGRLGRSAAEQNSQMGPWESPAHYTVSSAHSPQTGQGKLNRHSHSLEARVWGQDGGRAGSY